MERMYFIGVSTSKSRIMDLFPRWAEALGLDAEIQGVDLELNADSDDVRDAVTMIRRDPEARGALVTTHKVAVAEHARDLFDVLDDWARRCGEISCIAKRSDGLVGWAKDPMTSWDSFVEIVGESYFADHPQAEVLCLGAGGSGTAFTSRLLTADNLPAAIHITNRSRDRLEFVSRLHRNIGSSVDLHYHQVRDVADNDSVLESLPPGSIVANATGMGKDRPGSPVSDDARFPREGVAWDFNYRGSLEFLAQARRQRGDRQLRVVDGWRYFLYGWSEHISEVFDLRLTGEQFDRLAVLAEDLRPVDV